MEETSKFCKVNLTMLNGSVKVVIIVGIEPENAMFVAGEFML